MNKKHKIALVGGGNIGSTIASYLAQTQWPYDVVLLDKTIGMVQGKALDLRQAAAVNQQDYNIIGTDDYKHIEGADVVIVTAGSPRKPGMSRTDLLNINLAVIKIVADGVKKYAPKAFVIVVTNPMDIMVHAFQKYSGLPTNQVVGMGGVLDSARFAYFIGQELRVSCDNVVATVIGNHGDAMVPLPRYSSVAGISLTEMVKQATLSVATVNALIEKTKKGGAEIVQLLQTGSAYHGPANAAISMANAYLFNQKKVMICSTYMHGEYGIKDYYLGVPVSIGAKGVEKIITLELDKDEEKLFKESADAVKMSIDEVNLL